MTKSETLPGRAGISTLFEVCLRRPPGRAARDLPLIVLLGKRGSGKTWMLEYLRDACNGSVAIPHVLIDCAAQTDRSVWRLSCDLADALQYKKWIGFGRLYLPRVMLGRLAAEQPQLPNSSKNAQEKLREDMRARFKRRIDPIVGLVTNVLQVLHVPTSIINLAAHGLSFVAGSRHTVDRLYRTGLQWYGEQGEHFGYSGRSGLSVLVELNRSFHDDDRREQAEKILCKAFLDDLDEAFSRRGEFNCAVLLDNCDDPAGSGLLRFLASLQAGRQSSAPLVVVAACRTLSDLPGLIDNWTFPWEAGQQGIPHIPDPEEADYQYWHDSRRPRYESASWWFPVNLRDLAMTELRSEHARFIHRLTGGHPWSASRLIDSISFDATTNEPIETQLRTVLDRFAPHAEYLLADLPTSLRRNLVRWSAASDIDTAASADIGKDDSLAATTLSDELVKRLWLIPESQLPGLKRRGPRLHPWIRRILLRELAATNDDMTRNSWSKVHRQLRDYAANPERDDQLDVAYHDLACSMLAPAVDYLADQFNQLDADSWIRRFDAITAAPSTRSGTRTPGDYYDALMHERSPADWADPLRNTLWSMVAARWIWADPLSDPLFELTDTIADGYAQLARSAQTGSARYRREAQTYRTMKAR